MLTRRTLLAAAPAALSSCVMLPGLGTPAAASPARLGDDGLYHMDWYTESFLDLAEDVAAATGKGKRMAVLISQKGCIFCKRMALEYFADPNIEGYVRDNFEITHLDLNGAREVTDFDGRKLPENSFARAYGVRLTPSFMFFPEAAADLGKRDPMQREVARMPGLLPQAQFVDMFRYVREKGYETSSSFSDWLKKRA